MILCIKWHIFTETSCPIFDINQSFERIIAISLTNFMKETVQNSMKSKISQLPELEIENGVAACAITSKNYLPVTRVLVDSFHRYHPETPFFLLLVDEVEGYFKPEEEEFELVELEQLNISNFTQFIFKYNILELNTAVKPYFLEYLFDTYKLKKLCYFDTDILILQPVTPLFDLLEKYSIVLTPHIISPIEEDGLKPSELTIIQAGIYNLGFIALSNTPITKQFLKWWQARLYNKCVMSLEQGIHVDQKWVDFAPAFCEGVYILKEPGYNVAYWNLNSRKVEIKGQEVFVNGKPGYFFHFSGFNPKDIKPVSKHQDRFDINKIGQAKILFEQYRELVLARGYERCLAWPYAFGKFDNGVNIADIVRKLYLNMGEKVDRFGNPFVTSGQNSYFSYLNQIIDKSSISRLWYEIYKSKPNLQQAYPDVFGKDRNGFIEWILVSGRYEHNIDDRLIPSRQSVSKNRPVNDPTQNKLKSILRRLLFSRVVRKIYKTFLRPMIPYLKTLLKMTFGRNHWIWQRLTYVNSRLNDQPIHSKTENNSQNVGQVKPFGVNICGYMNSEKGVGEAVRSNIRDFEILNIPYELNNICDYTSINNDKTYTEYSDRNPYLINLVQVNADAVPNFMEKYDKTYLQGHYNIGYWNWELSTFPPDWLSSFEYFDEIWVPTCFTQDSVSHKSPVPVIKIPLSMNEDFKLADLNRTHFNLDQDSFVFLFIFDFHSYAKRKNPLAIIQAFQKAFVKKDNVNLVLKCSHPEKDTTYFKQLQDAAKNTNIIIINRILDREEINSLMCLSDCYVSLHRSEGFGLTISEAMRMSKPVIATGYSGNMDFMNINNSFPVKYKLVEVGEKDYPPFKSGYMWADPDINHAAELMRFVYDNQDYAVKIGKQAAEDVKRDLSPLTISDIIKKRFELIIKSSDYNRFIIRR
jgi:glycosyltransferase involved in cell wall biosynthesis